MIFLSHKTRQSLFVGDPDVTIRVRIELDHDLIEVMCSLDEAQQLVTALQAAVRTHASLSA